MAHLSSDVVRKARRRTAPSDQGGPAAYRHEATLATSRELGQREAAAVSAGCGPVVDATLGDREAREALRDGMGLATAARLRYVEWRVTAAEAARRARARERDAGRESDAGADVAARLASAWAALDEVSAERHLGGPRGRGLQRRRRATSPRR